jgi:leader peptidase (prepilin peptidase)/N-methyltransferase
MTGSGDALLDILVFCFGASIGSFVNVLAYRLPRDISIVQPRSFCPHCRRPIPAWLNIPVLGYLIARGQCVYCHARIPFRYPITELALGLTALMLYANFAPLDATARLILCAGLFAASWVDLDCRLIPDVISLPGIVVGFIAAVFLMPDIGWKDSLLGIAIGGGLLFGIGQLYIFLRGKEGMGMGDVKLLAMIGAFLGWQGILFTLFVGSTLGAAGGILLGLLKWQPGNAELRAELAEPMAVGSTAIDSAPQSLDAQADVGLLQTPVPFGPFLSLAGAIFAIFQPQLLQWYSS